MLTELHGLPSHVAAFRATGTITGAEYKEVAIPVMDRIAASHESMNFLVLLETNLSDINLGAWARDIGAGFKYFNKWKRLAIVSDQDIMAKIPSGISSMIPGEIRGFKLSELEGAKKWVAG